jgi:DNA-binding Xre family transcriptional regulator
MLEQKKEQGNSPAPSKKYIRKKELKKQLGISDSTVRRLVLNGYIEQFEFAGILYYDWEKICQQFKKCRGGKNQ